MEQNRFRPRPDGLEDRITPNVSPGQVNAALIRVEHNHDGVRALAEDLGAPRSTQAIQNLATKLPQVAAESRADAVVLGEFLGELRARMAANPALVSTLGPLAGGVGVRQFQAVVTAAYADVFAIGFGAPPPAPPPPPPFVDTPPNFGVSPPPPPTTAADVNTPTGTPSRDDSADAVPSTTLPPLSAPQWQTLPSGVRVWDVKEGQGTPAQVDGTITAHYTGWLADGTKFQSSHDSGQPFTATLSASELIQGWVEGLPGLEPGGVRRLYIPAALAYGSQSRTGIPPNSDLVFEVELISAS